MRRRPQILLSLNGLGGKELYGAETVPVVLAREEEQAVRPRARRGETKKLPRERIACGVQRDAGA